MTTRTVTVRMTVQNAQAVGAIKQTGTVAEQTAARMTRSGKTVEQRWATVGRGARNVAIGGALALGVIEKANYSFDKSMSRVDAATHASASTLKELRDAAVEAGAKTVYSSAEAADGITELAKAGVSARDILGGGLTGALSLAAAGELSVADSAADMATALTQFQLPGTKATHVADLLAAGAGKAQGEVSDMALALNYAGVPAAQLGVSIEQTAGTIALLAKNGILGEKAGTGLRGILSSLTSPSQAAKKEMDRLGISVFDAQGNFIGLDGLAGQLHRRLSGLTQAERSNALGRIFGNAQLTAANVLYREGAKGVHTWTKNVNDSGYAADTAKRKLNNLAGDVEYLKGDLEALFIKRGGGAQDGLRDMVQFVDRLVVGFGRLPNAVQSGIVKVTALATATAAAVYVASKLVKGYAATKDVLGIVKKASTGSAVGSALAGQAGVVKVFVTNPGFTGVPGKGLPGKGEVPAVVTGTSRALKVATVAIEAGTAIFGAKIGASIVDKISDLGKQPNETQKPFTQFEKPRTGIDRIFGAGESVKGAARDALNATSGFGKASLAGDKLIGHLLGIKVPAQESIKKIQQLDDSISKMADSSKKDGLEQYNQALKKSGLTAGELNKILPKSAQALGLVQDRQRKLTAADLRSQLALQGFGKAQINSAVASFKATQGLDRASAASEKYASRLHTIPKDLRLYVSTPGVITSIKDMASLARAYKLTPKQIKTIMLLQGFTETQAKIAAAGQRFRSLPRQVKTALRADTVKSLADVRRLQKQYGLTKPQVTTVMKVSGVDKAIADARRLRNEIAAIKSKSITISIHRGNAPTGPSVGAYAPDAQAEGGTVAGPRFPYRDSRLILAAPGEEIITNRRGEADRFRRDRASGRIPRYADGGTVGASAVSGGTGTPAVTVIFPAPTIYKAAVKAADDIAAAGVKSTATAKDLRAIHLDDLHQQQQIRELQKSLNEHTKKGYTLKGLNRTTAKAELADAKLTLVEMRKQNDVQKQIADAKAEALTAQQDARKEAATSLSSGLDLLSRSAGSSPAYVQRFTADVAQFGGILARLRAAKASPMLLQQMVDHANQGDFRTAIRFGQALLDQPGLLATLNASLGSLGTATSSVANLTTDPRFLGSGAFNPISQTVSTVQAQVNLMADPSTWMSEILRQMNHLIDTKLAGVVK